MEIPLLYDKTITCRNCQRKYKTKKVMSDHIRTEKMDTDFCIHYTNEEANPDLYVVNVCLNCGYSSSEIDGFEIYGVAKEKIDTQLTSKWSPRDLSGVRNRDSAIEALLLAVYCSQLVGENHVVRAGLLIRIAWFYRKEEKRELEERYMKKALEAYINSYSVGDYERKNMPEETVVYIIGELYFRLGDTDEARRYFFKSIQQRGKLESKAREQLEAIKECQMKDTEVEKMVG